MNFPRTISLVMMVAMLLPEGSIYSAAKKERTIAIVPIHDSVGDDVTDTAAIKLNEALKRLGRFHVVTDENMKSVLKYHKGIINSGSNAKFRDDLGRARELYYEFNYIDAKVLVRQAISAIEAEENGIDKYGAELRDAYVTMGIVSRSMGDVEGARQALKEALRLDPKYQLDALAFPPSMVKVFEEVRSSIDALPRGDVKVESTPKVADVYLNGILQGVAPITIKDVPAGKHLVRVSANKYRPRTKEISVENGSTTKLKEMLEWSDTENLLNGETYITQLKSFDQVNDALKIADILKVNSIILVNAGDEGAEGQKATVKLIDAEYGIGHKPIIVSYGENELDTAMDDLAGELFAQSKVNVAKAPAKLIDPVGAGNARLLAAKEKSKVNKPLIYGIVGGVLAAGLGAGLAAAFVGGGSRAGGTGSINVQFK